MAKFRDVKPAPNLQWWANIGNKCVSAQLLDDEIELFRLWSNQNLGEGWTLSDTKIGWYFKDEYAENLNFFSFP